MIKVEIIDYCFLFSLYLSMTYWMFRKYPSNILKNSIKIPIFVVSLPFFIIVFMYLNFSIDKMERIFYKLFGFNSGDILRITIGMLILMIMIVVFMKYQYFYILAILIIEILVRFDKWIEKQKSL